MSLIHRFGFLVALGGLALGAVAGCVANPYKISFEGDAGVIPPDGVLSEPPPDVSDLDAGDEELINTDVSHQPVKDQGEAWRK